MVCTVTAPRRPFAVINALSFNVATELMTKGKVKADHYGDWTLRLQLQFMFPK